MRWLVGGLLVVNLLVYFYREQAQAVIDSVLQKTTASHNSARNTIYLVGETPPPRADDFVVEAAAQRPQQEPAVGICWRIQVDPEYSGGDGRVQQEILDTLAQHLRALDVSVQWSGGDAVADGPNGTHATLLVQESERTPLTAKIWQRLQLDWPEIIREKTPCESVAKLGQLH